MVVPSIRRFMKVPVFALDEAAPKLVAARKRAEQEIVPAFRRTDATSSSSS